MPALLAVDPRLVSFDQLPKQLQANTYGYQRAHKIPPVCLKGEDKCQLLTITSIHTSLPTNPLATSIIFRYSTCLPWAAKLLDQSLSLTGPRS